MRQPRRQLRIRHGRRRLPTPTRRFPHPNRRPKVGDLVLFPSSLFHRTIPFNSDQERICIAFDIKPGNSVGSKK
ncbi:putative 2OG-Fe(II) oxygenase [Methylomonas koyamae]|uniref:putative 2OG-Fe(II) oxygenase n=1 Tax=Methylomonas koyamae TaxID=702114 RepID=UPI0035709CBF